MANPTIKHFIFMRFFDRKIRTYPFDIFDVNFLSKQLVLVNNAFRTLENQSNQNFELVFLTNEKFLTEKKYEFILSTLKNSTTLPFKFIPYKDYPYLVVDAMNEYEFVIQSRLDFDDFIHKDLVADTQNKINECDRILAYGYCKGYQYILGELYTYFCQYSLVGHHSLLQSLIMDSSFAKKLPFIGIHNLPGIYPNMYNKYISHTKIKNALKEFLESNGVELAENMFIQNISPKSFIYFRHDFSQDQFQPWGNLISPLNIKNFTTKDDNITKKQLEEEFGFTGHELKSIE